MLLNSSHAYLPISAFLAQHEPIRVCLLILPTILPRQSTYTSPNMTFVNFQVRFVAIISDTYRLPC